MLQGKELYSKFKQETNKYTCKVCNKVIQIESGSGSMSTVEKTFLILNYHLETDHK